MNWFTNVAEEPVSRRKMVLRRRVLIHAYRRQIVLVMRICAALTSIAVALAVLLGGVL